MTKEQAEAFTTTTIKPVLATLEAAGFTDVTATLTDHEGEPCVTMAVKYKGERYEYGAVVGTFSSDGRDIPEAHALQVFDSATRTMIRNLAGRSL